MKYLGVISTKFRINLCKYFPKIAIWIYSKHKGRCKGCGNCCNVAKCRYIKDNKCIINGSKPLSCRLTPFPFDKLWDDKYKNCGIYYGRKKL